MIESDARRRGDAAGSAAERSFTPVFVVLLILFVLPLWSSRYLPMVDLPQHLALINIHQRLDDPTAPFGRFFAPRPGFTPYIGYYRALDLLAFVFPLEIANRIFLTACVAGIAAGACALAASLGRSRWVALFALPLAFAFDFHIGFVNHLAGVAVLLGGLALYAFRIQGRLRGAGWRLLAVAAPVACLITHPLPYGFFLAGLAVLVATRAESGYGEARAFSRVRAATDAAVNAAPSMAIFLWWLWRQQETSGARGLWAGVKFDPFPARLSSAATFLLDQFTDRIDTIFLVLLTAAWIWAMGAGLRRRAEADSPASGWTAPLLAGAAMAAYFAMPTHAALMQHIHPRFAGLGALMLAVAIPLRPGESPAAWRAFIASVCAAHAVYLTVQFHRFDLEAGDFEALAAKVEAGSCVAALGGYMETGVLRDAGAYNHFAGYISLRRNAVPGYTFAYTRHSPLAYRARDGSTTLDVRKAALPEIRNQERLMLDGSLYAAYGGFYRYFLLPSARPPETFFGSDAARLTRLAESGPLALYLNPEGRCGR